MEKMSGQILHSFSYQWSFLWQTMKQPRTLAIWPFWTRSYPGKVKAAGTNGLAFPPSLPGAHSPREQKKCLSKYSLLSGAGMIPSSNPHRLMQITVLLMCIVKKNIISRVG